MYALHDDIVLACSHQAQLCYCGELNCLGFIGGKTQTDIAAMDDLYLDGSPKANLCCCWALIAFVALGITDEADILELKGTKKKRGKKIDDPDFMVRHYMHLVDIIVSNVSNANGCSPT